MTQNTLLIRIGFTAVLILVGIYIYRTVFKQRVNASDKKSKVAEKPVEQNSTAKEKEAESAPAANEKTAAPKTAEAAATATAVLSEAQVAEMTRLKDEVQKLSADLASSLAQNEELKKNSAAVTEPEVVQSAKERISEAGGDELAAELQDKIQQLESRLAEYEIIAEDIAEISQLRQENQELRKKTSTANPESSSSESEMSTAEPVIEAEEVVVDSEPSNESSDETSDEIIADIADVALTEELVEPEISAEPAAMELSEAELLRAELEALTDQIESVPAEEVFADKSAEFNLVSEKPVTQTEQELIDQFEQDIDNKKDS